MKKEIKKEEERRNSIGKNDMEMQAKAKYGRRAEGGRIRPSQNGSYSREDRKEDSGVVQVCISSRSRQECVTVES